MTKKYTKHLVCVFTALALLVYSWPQASAQSLSTSSWIKTGEPQLELIQELSPSQYQNDSSECIPNTKFITVPRDIISSRVEKSHLACATPTAFGYHDSQTGEIMLTGSSVSGKIQTHEGGNLVIRALSNKDSVMYFNSQEPLYGSYRYIIDDFSKKIDVIQQSNGTIVHKLRMTNPGVGIKDSGGKLINFSGSHFSNDARWMIGNAHLRGMFRINMITGENLIYGGGYNHAIGMSPSFVSAISSSGRYAIDTENRYGIFRVYDFDTCIKNLDPLKPADCRYRDLNTFINSRVPNFQRVLKAEFSTEHTIRLTIQLNNNTYRYYTLTAQGENESSLDYLALGDSFASGEGAENYKSETDMRNLNTCHLSRVSYPYLPPLRKEQNGAESIACSGAKLKDIFNDNYHEGTAQAKEKNDNYYNQEIFSSYLPGYRPQAEFAKRTKPKDITISVGGNNIGFSKMILECLQPGTCYTDTQERLDIAHTINHQFNDLVSTYQKLKNETRAGGTVYVIGYPSIAAENGNCASNVLLNAEEIKFSNQILQQLNSVIEAAAKKAGVAYIDVTNALQGYRLCETERRESAVNGGMLGDDETFSFVVLDKYLIEGYFTNSGSYHPNERGHQLLADFIRRATNEFSLSNSDKQAVPAPSLDSTPILPPESHKNLTPHIVSDDGNITSNFLKTTEPNPLSLSEFKPFSEVQLRIGSTSIGKFSTDGSGNLLANFTVPDILLGSLQVLHATGKNRSGEGIDKQKITYISNAPSATRPADIFTGFTVPDISKTNSPENNAVTAPSLESKNSPFQAIAMPPGLKLKVAQSLPLLARFPQSSLMHVYNPDPFSSGKILGDTLEQPIKALGRVTKSGKQMPKYAVIVATSFAVIALVTRIMWRKRLQYNYLE